MFECVCVNVICSVKFSRIDIFRLFEGDSLRNDYSQSESFANALLSNGPHRSSPESGPEHYRHSYGEIPRYPDRWNRTVTGRAGPEGDKYLSTIDKIRTDENMNSVPVSFLAISVLLAFSDALSSIAFVKPTA